MIKVIKESFNITNSYLILATPLILFSLISTLYLVVSSGANTFGLIFSAILFFLMFGAFLSGWFFMIAKVVKNPNNDDKEKIIYEFPAGVGEFFIIILCAITIFLIVTSIIFISSLYAGKTFIGTPNIPYSQISSALANVEAMKEFVNSLSPTQLALINKWNLLLFGTTLLNYFILIFYIPVLFFKRKNPFIALFICLKDLFARRFFQNFGFYIFICISYMILSLLMSLSTFNSIIHFIMTLISFYYATFITVLIFNYYYSYYIKIGSNVDKIV